MEYRGPVLERNQNLEPELKLLKPALSKFLFYRFSNPHGINKALNLATVAVERKTFI